MEVGDDPRARVWTPVTHRTAAAVDSPALRGPGPHTGVANAPAKSPSLFAQGEQPITAPCPVRGLSGRPGRRQQGCADVVVGRLHCHQAGQDPGLEVPASSALPQRTVAPPLGSGSRRRGCRRRPGPPWPAASSAGSQHAARGRQAPSPQALMTGIPVARATLS